MYGVLSACLRCRQALPVTAQPRNPHPVVAVNVAPDEPPTRGEAREKPTQVPIVPKIT
ncbi:MAG: hypothetical protein J7L38_02175 [Thermoproteales archaeon]|nr:hypothetical protein [Thermoproteales archaeon]